MYTYNLIIKPLFAGKKSLDLFQYRNKYAIYIYIHTGIRVKQLILLDRHPINPANLYQPAPDQKAFNHYCLKRVPYYMIAGS